MVPALAADATMDRQTAAAFGDWLTQLDVSSPLVTKAVPAGRPIPGPGRLTATHHPHVDGEDPAVARGDYLELHADGAFFGAHTLDAEDGVGLHPLHLADAVMLLAEVGVRWAAERTGRWGTATVICGLHAAGRPQQAFELRQHAAGQSVRLPHTRQVVATPGSLRARSTADLSVAASVQDRMVVAYQAGSGLVQHSGCPSSPSSPPPARSISTSGATPRKKPEGGPNGGGSSLQTPPRNPLHLLRRRSMRDAPRTTGSTTHHHGLSGRGQSPEGGLSRSLPKKSLKIGSPRAGSMSSAPPKR